MGGGDAGLIDLISRALGPAANGRWQSAGAPAAADGKTEDEEVPLGTNSLSHGPTVDAALPSRVHSCPSARVAEPYRRRYAPWRT